jgi:hypothetical protein
VTDPLAELRDRLADHEPLDVSADLELRVDDERVTVESYTDRLVVTVPSFGAGWRLFRGLPFDADGGGRVDATDLAGLLASTGLSAELRIGPRPVARLGAGVTPGLLARVAGLGPFRLLPGGLVGAVLG